MEACGRIINDGDGRGTRSQLRWDELGYECSREIQHNLRKMAGINSGRRPQDEKEEKGETTGDERSGGL